MPPTKLSTSALAGLATFFVLMIGGIIGSSVIADRYVAAHTAEWGHPMKCRLGNPSQPYEMTVNNAGGKLVVRTIDVICPSSPDPAVIQHNINMPLALSYEGTTRVWHNSRTGHNWFENSASHYNGDNIDSPPTGSAWQTQADIITVILAGAIAIFVARFVGHWQRRRTAATRGRAILA
jgi:hypothetical protein